MAKRWLLLAAILLVCSHAAFARQKVLFWCEQGGVTIQIPGTQGSTTKFQQSFPGCTVTVYTTGTTNIINIYSDNAGTPKANPFTTSATTAQGFFYADNQRVDMKFTGTGLTTFTLSDILLNDSAQLATTLNAMAYSATPTFDASLYSLFTMTLTGNVTSSTITNSVTGQLIGFNLCQDGTGGRTFAWPASFLRPPTISGMASACTNPTFFYDGTNWRQLAATGDSLAGAIFAGNFTLNGPTTLTPTTLNSGNFYYFDKPSTSHGDEGTLVWGLNAGTLQSSATGASSNYGNILIGNNVGPKLFSTTPDTDVEITAVGDGAIANMHGSLSGTFIGRAVGASTTTGGGSATWVGHAAMLNNTTGGGLGTVAVGDSTGAGNLGGTACTTGCSDAVIVGEEAGLGSGASQVNTFAAIGPRSWVNCNSCGDLGGTLLPLNWGINNPNPLTPLSPMVQAAKATAATNTLAFFSTNDAANPFGLEVDITGAAAIANRSVQLQTKDISLANGGTLNLNIGGGNLGLGTTNSTLFIGFTDNAMGRCGSACTAFGDGSSSFNANAQLQFKSLTLNGGTTLTGQTGSGTSIVTNTAPTIGGQLTLSQAVGTAPLVVTSTTPVANLTLSSHPVVQDCGTTTSCSHSALTSVQIVRGSVALSSATPSTATVTGISPTFTSSSSYVCTATPQGATAAIAAGGIAVSNVSSSSFTLTGPNTVTTVINYVCIGT